MRFRFDVRINGIFQRVEQGLTNTRDFEEGLDGGKLKLILQENSLPIEQFSYVEITVYEVDESETLISTKEYEYIVVSDEVETNSKYGFYEHELTVMEFTGKMDLYNKAAFQFSKDIFEERTAPYEYILSETLPSTENINYVITEEDTPLGYNVKYTIGFHVRTIPIPQVILGNHTLKKVEQASYARRYVIPVNGKNFRFEKGDIYIRAVSNGNQVFYGILSDSDLELSLPSGEYEIYLGIKADITPLIDEDDDSQLSIEDYDVYRYFIEVRDITKNTMYDVIMELRDLVSKYGGIESKKYFNITRMFNLNEDDAEYLKTVEAPQIYIPSATLRQMLVFVLSFVNAVPRLKNGFIQDELSLEFFGKNIGSFIKKDITEEYSEQNINQIGTRSYAELHNILPNDLGNATTYDSYQDGFKTVRATNIELIDNQGYVLKLPQGKPLYKPTRFRINIPVVAKAWEIQGDNLPDVLVDLYLGDLPIDVTDILINNSEWQLKEITPNFPSAYYTTGKLDTQKQMGLNLYKTENFTWQEGATEINLSQVFGQLFQSNLLLSVIKHEINKFLITKGFENQDEYLSFEFNSNFYNVDNIFWFKEIGFNLEYITNENMSIKQDKEDLEQISFYSEIRHNQDENTVSLARSSAKIYGDLQRTGNKNNTFSKVHRSLSDLYDVGKKDKDDYTITKVQTQWFNDYVVATYTVVKHHNRISQATFIDQTYRWRDNYASELKQRSETYNDYVFLLPYDSENQVLENEETKIVFKRSSNQVSQTGVPYFYDVLFGSLGVNHNLVKTKATVALIRTDGTLTQWVEEVSDTEANFISTPISSAGFKGGLVFKISFEDNQVAGDGLIQNEQGNWFNSAVRYTDKGARLKYLDFYILNNIPQMTIPNRNDIYPRYMINPNDNVLSNSATVSNNSLLYFSTGNPVLRRTADDSLIINKDPLSNLSINYAVNIMSYYYGLVIFGRDFYTNNHLVYNPNDDKVPYLYIYDNGTFYEIFEDLKIKSGWRNRLSTKDNPSLVRVIKESGVDVLEISGLVSSDTSWAIGDEFGNLILACNENISKFELVRTHIRPNVKVVGIESETINYRLESYINIGIISSRKETTKTSFIGQLGFDITQATTMSSRVESYISVGYTYQIKETTKTSFIGGLAFNVEQLLTKPMAYDFGIYMQLTYNKPNVNKVIKTNNLAFNTEWETSTTSAKTATPTVGNPSCRTINNMNRITLSVRNNDPEIATIRMGTTILGTLSGGSQTTYTIETNATMPYSYSFNITAKANTKETSNAVSRSGTITICSIV